MSENKVTIDIVSSDSVVNARRIGRELAAEAGFGRADQTRLATAISELARNVIQHAEKGKCTITINSESIQVDMEDQGPGIKDTDQALGDGFSTGKGMGAGLPGVKRLAHQIHIESQAGYTKITIIMKL